VRRCAATTGRHVAACDDAHRFGPIIGAPSRSPVWSAPVDGPIAAWAEYDIEGSKQLGAYLFFIEWCGMSGGYHSSWCYCYPKRPTEWIFGRGRLGEPV
jgi:hypothetical protein